MSTFLMFSKTLIENSVKTSRSTFETTETN